MITLQVKNDLFTDLLNIQEYHVRHISANQTKMECEISQEMWQQLLIAINL